MTPDTLPPLPDPDHALDCGNQPFYRPDQMREYARQSVYQAEDKWQATLAAQAQQSSDAALCQALEERDRYHEASDDLAAQIAAITEVEIGEHSSANDPWHNAMLAADEFLAKNFMPMMRAAYNRGQAPSAQDLEGLAHQIYSAAQLAPGEGVVDGVDRIVDLLKPAAQDTGIPEGYKLLDDGKTAIPQDWTWCRIEHEPGYPEDVAFGPDRMMTRLKKWLDAHFAAKANGVPLAVTEARSAWLRRKQG